MAWHSGTRGRFAAGVACLAVVGVDRPFAAAQRNPEADLAARAGAGLAAHAGVAVVGIAESMPAADIAQRWGPDGRRGVVFVLSHQEIGDIAAWAL